MLSNKNQASNPSICLVKDTIILKDGETYIVYSPFTNLISRVKNYPISNNEIYRILQTKGFFSNVPSITKRDDGWQGFHSLTLLITRKCNLGCHYCYASAKPNGASMPLELAIGALEWFVYQLVENKIRITFHGGGEPTLEQVLIKSVVKRTDEIKDGRTTSYLITTNGTSDQKFIDWMIANKFNISISMDGPPAIQDRNRPFVGGTPSSTVVERNIRYLISCSYPFTIRVTYSPTDDIIRVINYFGDLGVKKIHLEPLFPYGRDYEVVEFGKNSHYEVYSPVGGELVHKFIEAMDACKIYGIKIYNGHLAHFTKGIGYFCGAASGRAMMVGHDGLLTACIEVVDLADKDADQFKLGEWIPHERRFDINIDKLKILQSRHADIIPECQTCFARYTCAGGCSVKAVRATGNFLKRDIPYCSFTKALVAVLIKKIAAASGF